MRQKILLTISIAFFLVLAFRSPVNAGPEECGSALQSSGCWICSWNDSTGRCAYENTAAHSAPNLCAPGYIPQSNSISELDSICSQKTFDQCGLAPILNACKIIPNENGVIGFFCDTSKVQNERCQPCDLDPATDTADCPSGVNPPYANYLQCVSNCEAAEPTACSIVGGACRNVCARGERGIAGYCVSGLGQACCFPDDRLGETGTGTKPKGPECSLGGSLGLGSMGNMGIDTAIGCIPIVTPEALYGFLLKWGVSIAGGVAFLMIVISSFLIIVSRGDPEKLKGGKELLTAAISGVLLLVFSIFILRVIGVNILGIFQ